MEEERGKEEGNQLTREGKKKLGEEVNKGGKRKK